MKKIIFWCVFVIALFVLTGCSTFESFHFKLPLEIAYGDTAVQAEQGVKIAKIDADKEVMKMAAKPHVVEVKLPPEIQPDVTVFDVTPPALAPGAAGMATMSDGTTLYDCVEEKGEFVICSLVPGQ